ncbi:hypothetical protein GGX14DRAFT_649825 [Mycena pura]|uniref:Uncharacterized protein n=1 Tax=Mycena pura TaxID=153505 RepID=A0AAD6YN22_9AGAR|nr:hypothetical protein GGX14DRAFT_649825 [Mycena pura]
MSLPDAASSNGQDRKVDSGDGLNDPPAANVDNDNVIPSDDENIHASQEQSSTTPPKTPPTEPASMPPLPDLSGLTLHSPSSVIIGTPFSDVHSARFEYPFPDKASTSSSPEITSSFSSISSSPSVPALVSVSQPQLVLPAPPTLQHFPASFPAPSELPNYSPTHPKMRAVNPPEPPSLTKRRQRWTLGLGSLTRKLSLRSGGAATGQESPGAEGNGRRRTMGDEHAQLGFGGGSTSLTTEEIPSSTRDDTAHGDGGGTGTYT